MVIGSTGPFAQLAGRKALELGGAAADAAITTALAQIALALGSWVSYAGIADVMYYDATTGRVRAMSAGWGTIAAETNPLSIPTTGGGRAALIPGFFAGMHAVHQRFGRLSWSELFLPALWLAERGFPLSRQNALELRGRQRTLAATPEARSVFFGADGSLPAEGEVFRQPLLAQTLRKVADLGVDYLYRGAWAEKFVEVTRAAGGLATLADLDNYQPVWSEPRVGVVNGFDVHVVGEPGYGGWALVNGLQLLEEAGLSDPAASAEDLYWSIQIARQVHMLGRLPGEVRVDREHARRVWKEMLAAGGAVGPGGFTPGTHSDFVTAKDQYGDVIAVCHTINVSAWGESCTFADGISIADAGRYQQPALALVPSGEHLPNPTNPAIVCKDGVPVLASSSIGAGLTEVTLQCLATVLLRGGTVAEAAGQPMFHSPDLFPSGPLATGQNVRWSAQATPPDHTGMFGAPYWHYQDAAQTIEDRVPPDIRAGAEAKGLHLRPFALNDPTLPRGYWVGIAIDPSTGACEGAKTPFRNGTVEGL